MHNNSNFSKNIVELKGIKTIHSEQAVLHLLNIKESA